MLTTFIRSNLLVLIIANSTNIFQYFYQFFMARLLNVESYGILNSVMSLSVVFAALAQLMPLLISKLVVRYKSDQEKLNFLVSRFLVALCLFLVTIFVILYFTRNSLAAYLNITELNPLTLFIFIFISITLVNYLIGILSGFLQYINAAIKRASLAFFKFLAGVIIVGLLGFSYNGALSAILLANIIVIIWSYFAVRKYVKIPTLTRGGPKVNLWSEFSGYVVPIGLSMFAFNFVANFDIVLVKNLLSGQEAGLYSVVSLLGKIAIFVPGVLIQVLFPQVSQDMQDGQSSVKTGLVVMGLTLTIAFGYVFVISLFPEFVIRLLFGAKYVAGAPVLRVIGIAMALFSVVNVMFNFMLAKEIYWYLYVSYAGIIGMLVLIYTLLNETMMQIAFGFLCGAVFLVVANGAIMGYYGYKTWAVARG